MSRVTYFFSINNFGEKADIKQAIVDLGIEYGLVTDYTSMIVLRDEVFASRNIDRANRKRLAIEQAAQQQRQASPATNRRVDTQQPMYKSPRPSFGGGGGGAIDPWMLALFGLLAATVLTTTRKDSNNAA